MSEDENHDHTADLENAIEINSPAALELKALLLDKPLTLGDRVLLRAFKSLLNNKLSASDNRLDKQSTLGGHALLALGLEILLDKISTSNDHLDKPLTLEDRALSLGLEAFLDKLSTPNDRLEFKLIVSEIKGCKIYIHPNEGKHRVPHFHVFKDGKDVSFYIETGERFKKHTGLERKDKYIKNFWRKERCLLASEWNESRPTNRQDQFFKIPSDWPCEDESKDQV